MKKSKKVLILGHRIGIKTYTGDTWEESKRNGSAKVQIRGWDYDANIEVTFDSRDSNEFIVCKAAALDHACGGPDWQWPWWRFSANRKLKYLKAAKKKQLFLESEEEK